MKTKIILFSLLFLCSCSIRRQVEQTQRSSTYDSVAVKVVERIDSVFVDRWHTTTAKGDTIYKTDSVVLFQYKWRTNTDTIIVNKTDTVYQERTVMKEVRKASRSSTAITIIFFGLMFFFVGYLAWKISTRR